MNNILYYPDVRKLKELDFWSKEKAFEFLCKEILERLYDFWENSFCIPDHESGSESLAIKDSTWLFHTFQSKFSKNTTWLLINSFFNWKELKSINDLEKWTIDTIYPKFKSEQIDVLHIFSLNESFQEHTKQVFLDKLQLFYKNISINRWTYDRINEILRNEKMIDVVKVFFPSDKYLLLIKEHSKQLNEWKSEEDIKSDIVKNEPRFEIEKFFSWNYTEKHKELAETTYKKYIFNKYSFFSTPSFEFFKEIEKWVEIDKFPDLAQFSDYNKPNFYNLIKHFTDELNSNSKYSNEKTKLDIFVDWLEERKWLLMNSWVNEHCSFEFDWDTVLFIDKKNGL